MSHLRVGVWISQELYNDSGYTVRDKAVSFIQNSDRNVSYDYNAIAKPETISAPTEVPNPDDPFDARYPCDQTFTISYENLYEWWKDYTSCELNNLEPDCNLLITRNSGICGGGRGGGTHAVANGYAIENLTEGQTYNEGCGAFSLGIVLQEVGHCTINVSDSDGDGHGDHDTCDNVSHNSKQYITPMGVSYDDELNSQNECGEYFLKPETSKHVHFEFDGCAE
ncbi:MULTISPECIES: hypothetical protein [Halomarina]|uniref:Uncharacterized protein n=2 Tax=Halomarina TaxID=871740 RepID=A0A6B0GIV1_9EURY|nr:MULTISPECIES: hypothetical protein [Halomarina]MWG33731.1 hypothetical protein [Halomarina oriensis]